MVAAAEKDGTLGPDTVLVESSSGNSGVALSTIAASHGIPFVCITDPRCNPAAVKLMRALGADVRIVEKAHPEAGYLQARLDAVAALCAADDRYLWLNQYANPANWLTHYETTAPEIARRYPRLDVLFVGVGTGGTAMGCARYFRGAQRPVRVVAIDAVGSVSFGAPAGRRLLPGIGASVELPLIEPSLLDDVVYVAEIDAVRHCRALARRGFVVGGSTGSVVAGAMDWLRRNDPERRLTSVAIAPDLGERYLDNVYDDHWVRTYYGIEALEPACFEGETAAQFWHVRKRFP